ncbi:winged helix-turn-helix domain-containing protein [Mesorhizobium yinganensis]|uniref:winged helix-turn-helix domain-containing protein n=1 Tax=Mesorhizobium yinganensis TaxID=3157707 RepID=UPI0032B8357B
MDSPALKSLRLNGRMVDVGRGSVMDAAGHVVTIRPQSAEVLKMLAARPGEIISKDALMQAVWGNIAVTDDSLVQCITEIRKALGDEKHEIVKTLVKRGYLLEAATSVEGPRAIENKAAAEGDAAVYGKPAVNLRALAFHRKSWLGIVAGLAIAGAAAAAYFLPVTKSGAEPPAIAVLPFDNMNGDARWDRFADGITEDIITDLARFRDIPVIARTSTEAYRDKADDMREIGRALNVKYFVEGSLQVDGERMRVTAQLINAETGTHLWSERYDRPAAELLTVQDEITEKIAATLTGYQGTVTEAERAIARRKNNADLDAYDSWLLGVGAKHRMSPQGLVEARAWFEKGLKLAPDFMPLVRDMGVAYSVEMDLGAAIDFPAWKDAERNYTEKAFSLDPNDAMVNAMMAVVHGDDEERAERYREQALQVAPTNLDVRMVVAWGLGGWQTERAAELIERTLTHNPRYPSWWNFPITQTWFAARRFDQAYAAAKHLGESPNQAAYLAMSAAQLGKQQEAADAAAKALRMNPDWTAESMFPYQNFSDETLLPEAAAKAALPVCMTAAQAAANTGLYRLKQCDEKRAQAASN